MFSALAMEKPALENVVQVLDTLFNSQETVKNHEASEWLTQLQASVREEEKVEPPVAILISALHLFSCRCSLGK